MANEPLGIAPGTYTLDVRAAGITSPAFNFTVTPQEATASGIALTYGGPGTAAALAEAAAGGDNVTVSEVSPGLLKIDLNGATFAAGSTASAAGLTYQNAGSPATSTLATLDVSAANDVTALDATLPDHPLTLGAIADAAGGLGGLDLAGAGVTVTGAVHVTAAGGTVTLDGAASLALDAGASLTTNNGGIALAGGTLTLGATSAVNAGTGTIALSGSVAITVAAGLTGKAATVQGGSGPDAFHVAPSTGAPITVRGTIPAMPATPGDTLDLNLAGVPDPMLAATFTPVTGFSGTYTFGGGFQPVSFNGLESLAPDSADLAVTTAASAVPVGPGATVAFTIAATNRGTLGVTGATVTDLFPAGATGFASVAYTRSFSSAHSGSSTPATGSGSIQDTVNLAAGDSVTYVVTAVVGPSASGALGDTATVGVPPGMTDGTPGNNSSTSTVTVVPPPAPPAVPPPTTGNVTAVVQAALGPAPGKKKRRSGALEYLLTITNDDLAAVQGPLHVLLNGLKRTVKVRGAAGFVGTGKKKTPFVAINVPGGALASGGSVSLVLRFSAKPNRVTPSVFAATAPQ